MSDATSNPELKRSLDQVSTPADADSEGTSEAKRPRVDQVKDTQQDAPVASTSFSADAVDSNLPKPEGDNANQAGDVVIPTAPDAEAKPTPSQNEKGKGRLSERKKRGRGPGARRTRNDEDASKDGTKEEGEEGPKAIRYPKRQCALLMGFCGSGYSGMQIQPDHTRTIEGVLFNALVKIGAVSQDNADNPTKVNLARAARTDAGVHAAGNIVSLKMIITIPGVKDIVARINEELPPEIRVWGYVRTQNSFNARTRKYTYYFPSYLLIPPKPGSGMHRVFSGSAAPSTVPSDEASVEKFAPIPGISYEFWKDQLDGAMSTKEEDMARKRAWRVGPEQMETLRSIVTKYLGTHNFHNFTVGRDFGDRSCKRYMKKIEVADPVVYGETEWISVLFHGQSFMLHQRKMMGALVLACRMGAPPSIINELYDEREVFVPKMPSLGLLLEEPLFDSYNQRMSVINAKLEPKDPEYRPLIDFDLYRDQINAFKDKFIYTTMRGVEDRDGLFDAWIRSIDAYAGNDMLYLNQSGIVPESAVIHRGEKRANPFKEKRIFDTTSFPSTGIKEKLENVTEMEDAEEEVIDKKHLAETEG
ncbi:tRNA pseudouridine synthase 1 [Psilocybe cubensis]|uniref:tRNA pseudouridine synthase 1 n=2 Tax=Psilocybe cubensis TaxID=181762 RepID=A0A8H7XTA5_PSICU|nr:tRNA pseudouridine synthase 1 [Psilocybe cubensis]KAH9479442.1 tRNA pseudouridine synthase 1 [Psilocybe cubensis]